MIQDHTEVYHTTTFQLLQVTCSQIRQCYQKRKIFVIFLLGNNTKQKSFLSNKKVRKTAPSNEKTRVYTPVLPLSLSSYAPSKAVASAALQVITDPYGRVRKNLRTHYQCVNHHELIVSVHMIVNVRRSAAKSHAALQPVHIGAAAG